MINYDELISEKVATIKPSGIRKFFDLAASMKGVISLGVGEPDFSTPWVVRQTAIDTLERKRIVYTANSGLAELRKEITNYIEKHTGVRYDSETETIVTVGGSEAIDLAIRSVVNPGDEVMIAEPCFVCYAPLVELMHGKAVPIVTKVEDKFKLTAEEVEKAITPKTKMLILPYPNNPTGAIMTKEDLEPIAELLRDTNILVLTDEIYSEMTYGREHFSIVSLPGMRERTIYVNGFSKAFAMTGWRLGYVTAPEPIAKEMLKIHQYGIMSSPTVSQYAAITALTKCENDVKNMVNEYNMRRRFLVKGFNDIGLECFEPEGAFYIFPSIKSTGLSSEDFCEKLLYDKNVAVVPGNAFGQSGEGHIRISYAYSLKHLTEALTRIESFVRELKK